MHKHLCGGQDGRESIHNCVRLCTQVPWSKKTPLGVGSGLQGMVNIGLHQSFGRFVVVVFHTVFVPNNLPIQFVDQFINCRVQVRM